MRVGNAEQSGTRLALDSTEYNLVLAEVVQSAGTSGFYRNLAALLARLSGCTDYLVVRYTPFGAPAFLVNEAMDAASVALYQRSLYRLDPLRRLRAKVRVPQVVSLRALSESAPLDERYMLELFKSAFIFDELSILLPAPGGVTVAVCCERRRLRFREADRALVEQILPVIAALHRLHVDRAFALASSRGDSEAAGQQNAFLILDRAGRTVHASSPWRHLEIPEAVLAGMLKQVAIQPQGQCGLEDDFIAFWEPLADDFPLAPAGQIVTVERQSAGALQLTLEDSLATFRTRWQLTERETDIVRLILVGYPNAHIASNLNISAGTVKNHRHRLYYKLDITTERELFSMFLSQVVGSVPGASALAES